jgi:hypothetical protein
MLAMKMRATDNLSQRSSRMVNCVVTRKLSVWHPDTGWSAVQPTRSVAWAMADILKAKLRRKTGRCPYRSIGAGGAGCDLDGTR